MAGVQQADEIVQDHRHRLAGRLGVAVRDLHRDLLVLAEHHRRLVVAVVDQRVVQAAEARAGIERDIGEIVALDQVDDDVGLPAAIVRDLARSLHRHCCDRPICSSGDGGSACERRYGWQSMSDLRAISRRRRIDLPCTSSSISSPGTGVISSWAFRRRRGNPCPSSCP